MRMTVYANSCTPTLGREHPIGTRAIAVLGFFLLKCPHGEKHFCLAFVGISFWWRGQPLRLVTVQEWLDVSGHSPLTDIPGWSPWRIPAKKKNVFFPGQFCQFGPKTVFGEKVFIPTPSRPRNFPRCHAHHSPGACAGRDHIVPFGLER